MGFQIQFRPATRSNEKYILPLVSKDLGARLIVRTQFQTWFVVDVDYQLSHMCLSETRLYAAVSLSLARDSAVGHVCRER